MGVLAVPVQMFPSRLFKENQCILIYMLIVCVFIASPVAYCNILRLFICACKHENCSQRLGFLRCFTASIANGDAGAKQPKPGSQAATTCHYTAFGKIHMLWLQGHWL